MKTTIRGRACAILRHEGRILLNRYGGDDFWALPGGSIEAGEFSADGLVREIEEEIGIRVGLGPLVWVIENLFEYRGTHYTEFGFYYEAGWPLAAPLKEGEFVGREVDQFFHWFDAAQMAALDLRPRDLRAPLLTLMKGGTPMSVAHFTFSAAPTSP